MIIISRLILVAVALSLWFLTQKLISLRSFAGQGIQDKVHDWTAAWNSSLNRSPSRSKFLLVSSSLGIDLFGLYLLGAGIFGASITPFIGLIVLFSLRQLSQYLTALPPPQGMIWYHPGVPSLFVTYGVSNDLFFSGHTALAVYGALQLADCGSLALTTLAAVVALYEITVVLLLRAHWTMDVYAGAVTALLVNSIAHQLGPWIDTLL